MLTFRQRTQKQLDDTWNKIDKIEDDLEAVLKLQKQVAVQLTALSAQVAATTTALGKVSIVLSDQIAGTALAIESQLSAQTDLIKILSAELQPTVPVGQKIIFGRPVSQ